MGRFLYLGSFLSGRESKMPIHTYTNWNTRPSDQEEQIEPFRKYFFICEGVNTETFYFRRLIDLRKQLGIIIQVFTDMRHKYFMPVPVALV